MIPLLGRTAVLVALAACAIGTVTGAVAGIRRSEEALRWTRWMAYAFGAAATAAFGLMELALFTDDFSVAYVAEVGSTQTPHWVTFVSLWSSLNGSILLWSFVLGVYVVGLAWTTRGRYPGVAAWALSVSLAVGVFFSFLVAGIANPFELVDPAPLDGPGPNPLLQNHILMVIHPPTLYLGYVGMTVPFAMGAASLLDARATLQAEALAALGPGGLPRAAQVRVLRRRRPRVRRRAAGLRRVGGAADGALRLPCAAHGGRAQARPRPQRTRAHVTAGPPRGRMVSV